VFQIPKAGAGLWKSLKRYKVEKATTYTMRAEVEALMGSFYGPRIPLEEIKIPEKKDIGRSTMQAFAVSKRSDYSISGDST
jgi:phage baseplate assembly protein W